MFSLNSFTSLHLFTKKKVVEETFFVCLFSISTSYLFLELYEDQLVFVLGEGRGLSRFPSGEPGSMERESGKGG